MNDLSGRDGTLTRPDYRSRVVDSRLSNCSRRSVQWKSLGRNGRGKTWTALSRSRSVDRLDDVAVFAAAQTDPALVLMGRSPIWWTNGKMYRKFGMPLVAI